jgi:hypothetical protein
MVKQVSIPLKDPKEEKELWRKIGKSEKKKRRNIDITKNIRVVQSIKAGHIRSGHAFH